MEKKNKKKKVDEEETVEVAKKVEMETIDFKKLDLEEKILVFLQLGFTICTFILLIAYIFDENVMIFLVFSLGMSLLTMSATTHMLYKKKYSPYIYALLGLALIIIVAYSCMRS